MKIKTAALFFKVLIKDLKFFSDFNYKNKEIFIPFDRVNLRMLTYFLFNNNILINDFLNNGILKKYNHLSQLWFNFFCYFLRAEYENNIPLIIFENLWYIGHFYHENMKKPYKRGSCELAMNNTDNELVYQICNFRNALKYGDYFVDFPLNNFEVICPFKGYNCEYSYNVYNEALTKLKDE